MTELLVLAALVCWPLSPGVMAVLWGAGVALARWGHRPEPAVDGV